MKVIHSMSENKSSIKPDTRDKLLPIIYYEQNYCSFTYVLRYLHYLEQLNDN